MSSELYPVCVEWRGPIDKHHPGEGVVKVGSVTVKLTAHPSVLAGTHEIHFSPSIKWFECRDDCVHPPRQLTPPEIQLLYAFCNKMIDAVRQALA